VTSEPMGISPPEPRLMSGDEPIAGPDARLRDFWAWCLSDLRTNTVRPMLAEFLVARALGAAHRPRIEWDAYDVRTPDDVRVEVKSGAYLQAWEQSRLLDDLAQPSRRSGLTTAGQPAAVDSEAPGRR
jgi:hypothetical protein